MADNSNVRAHRCNELLKAKQSIRYGYGTDWKAFQREENIGWWIYGWHGDSEYDPIFTSLFKLNYCPFCGAKLEKGAI